MSADSGDDKDQARRRGAERNLFRAAVRGVKRLPSAALPPRPPKPRPRARFARLDAAAVLAESLSPAPGSGHLDSGEESSFRRTGVPESVLRKLRRGEYRIEAQIDLHGLTALQAKQTLREFLKDLKREGVRCARIVHGKGRRSGHGGPVLKPAVQAALQQIEAVVAYCSARAVDGGTGALYVLLRWQR